MLNLRSLCFATISVAVGALGTSCGSSDKVVSPPERWVLTMSDEFNSVPVTSPSAQLWTIETGYGPDDDGWGNDEWQLYTTSPDNVRVERCNLVISAQCTAEQCDRPEHKRDGSITSARIKTKVRICDDGLTECGFDQEHGRFEARIKLPEGAGLWPAFWMLGANIDEVPWPGCGEIDIMENVGREPERVFGSLHGPGYSGGEAISRGFQLPADRTFDATMDEAKTGGWSGNVVARGPSTSTLIEQANIGVGTVEPNSEVTISFALRGDASVELATNGGFETGTFEGWNSSPSRSASCAPTDETCTAATMVQAKTGDWSGNVVARGPSTSALIKQEKIGIGIVQPNQEVTVEFALLGSAIDGGQVVAEFFSEVDGGSPSKTEILGGAPIVPNAEWVTYSYTVTTGDDVSGGVTLQLKAECGAAESCEVNAYFDDVTIKSGGAPIVPSAEWVTYSYTVTTGDDVSGGVTLQLKAECGAAESCV
jgi:hypothetical protein